MKWRVPDSVDRRIDRMREQKFRADLKDRLVASGLSVVITVDGLLIEYPNGESCVVTLSNTTGRKI